MTRLRREGSLRRSVVAAGLAVALTVLTACSSPLDRPTAEQLPGPVPDGVIFRDIPATAPPAPDGDLTLLNGDAVSLSSLASDRPVVLLFFEAWCEQCAAGQDELNAAANAYGDAVTFVSVAGESTVDEAKTYATDHDIPYLVALDPSGDLWESYAVEEAPFTVFIGPGGALVRGWPGYIDGIQDAIAAILVTSMPDDDG